MQHTFHIPVLGLGYSIDTPLKVARYGISSVVSIVDDELTERMRKYHAALNHEPYHPISKTDHDGRALRITAYLNLLQKLVSGQITALKALSFDEPNDLCKYFDLLPSSSGLRSKYNIMLQMPEGIGKDRLIKELKEGIKAGDINVNIMSKVDKANYQNGIYTGDKNTDALAAIRGFAASNLNTSVVISAGLNPRLFSYMEELECFLPSADGHFLKKIILKVSDYRSAIIQAKVLAKKGLWVSEFRIESGLNCGGHAFATEGLLLGPILQEFKDNRKTLYQELLDLYQQTLEIKNMPVPSLNPVQLITVQGGIGTSEEHEFLINYYQLDATGWGSPFLLVPEATSVDVNTLSDLKQADENDFYLSNASPLGIPFNNFRKSTSERQRLERIERGRPGSPCTKKYLCSNTEFTDEPICTASREYQHLKIRQLKSSAIPQEQLTREISKITEKLCLCVGLCNSAYLKYNILKPRENQAVSICPGPNLAYFSGEYSLKEMVGHIYGRENVLGGVNRPNLFVKEFGLYVDYLRKEIEGTLEISAKKAKYFSKFYDQLTAGVKYYKDLIIQSDLAKQIWDHDQLHRFEMISNKLVSSVRPALI
ncbi:hypothetical protein [Pedobacter ginsengisoli]|uniref:hypothetical protein n=1 Tax=Pedobacter ginsengisoli TaxID=363852 RepID=UPI002551B13B|nr:hypothetical protein [Pedobacter ginsengisoli]